MILTRESLPRLGAFIGLRRQMAGLTQTQLAGKVYYSKPSLCKIEHGTMTPRLEVLCDLCEVLGLEIEIREVTK